MKKLLTYTCVLFLLNNCGYHYQVAFVSSANVPVQSERYAYENDTLKITYDFWANRGVVAYSIYNKLNTPIYIDWKKCAYLRNGEKNDYWQDMEIIAATTNTKGINGNVGSAGAQPYGGVSTGSFGYSNSKSETSGSVTKAERITFIPAKSSYSPQAFFIGRLYGVSLAKEVKPVKIPRIDNAAKFSKAYVDSFQKDESPIVFRVYLTYSTKEDFASEAYVDNEFYVSKIIEMGGRQFAPCNTCKSYYGNSKMYYTILNPEEYR